MFNRRFQFALNALAVQRGQATDGRLLAGVIIISLVIVVAIIQSPLAAWTP